jgi:glycosyltransferase involved in cell wall biosynthesis
MPTKYPKSIVHTEASHGWGGQELRILSESKWFLAKGTLVTIVADKRAPIFQEASRQGIPTHPARLRRKSLLDLWSLSRALQFLAPEIVVTHSSTDHWLAALSRLLFGLSYKIVRIRHVSAQVGRRIATAWLYNNGTDYVVTTSSEIKSNLTFDGFLPRNKVAAVPTGIDLEYFNPSNKYQSVRERLGIPKECRVLGNIATLRSWKGQSDLIKAFELLADSDIHLLIIGDGPARQSLKLLRQKSPLQNNIHMIGHSSDIRPFLKEIDLFVFPSYANEGVPQAVLQAMSFNLRIVASSLPGIREALGNYKLARLFEPRNIAAIAKEIGDILSDQRSHVGTSTEKFLDLDRISIHQMGESMRQVYVSDRKPTLSIHCRGDFNTPSTRIRVLQSTEVLEQHYYVRTLVNRRQASFREVLLQPDLMYLQKILPRVQFWIWRNLLRRSKVICDFDDSIWEPTHGRWDLFTRLRVSVRMFFLDMCVDRVTVPSEKLALSFKKASVVKIPIATYDPFPCHTRSTKDLDFDSQISIGWSGHPQSHFQIEAIYEYLRRAKKKFPNIKVFFLSGTPPKTDSFFEWIPFTEKAEREFYEMIDIGIVPIEDTTFSHGKSPVKIVQHFSYGRTVVTNGMGATREMCTNENSYIVRSFSELENVIQSCIENRDLYLSKCNQARKTFLESHDLKNISRELLLALQSAGENGSMSLRR